MLTLLVRLHQLLGGGGFWGCLTVWQAVLKKHTGSFNLTNKADWLGCCWLENQAKRPLAVAEKIFLFEIGWINPLIIILWFNILDLSVGYLNRLSVFNHLLWPSRQKQMCHSFNVLFHTVFCPGVGMSGASHRNDVRLQEAGEDSCKEEERRRHGSQWETDPGGAGQSVCGEITAVTHFLSHPFVFCLLSTVKALKRPHVVKDKSGDILWLSTNRTKRPKSSMNWSD